MFSESDGAVVPAMMMNVGSASGVSTINVMTVDVPASNNWEIGATLDTNFGRKANPFTADTTDAFIAKWNELKEAGQWDAFGVFEMTTRLVQSQEDKLEAIGVEGQLEASFTMFSVC